MFNILYTFLFIRSFEHKNNIRILPKKHGLYYVKCYQNRNHTEMKLLFKCIHPIFSVEEILDIIDSYLPTYNLLKWIKVDKIPFNQLINNEHEYTSTFLLKNYEKINIKKINTYYLSLNPTLFTLKILMNYPEKFNSLEWSLLSLNGTDEIINYLEEKHFNNIDWDNLCLNTTSTAINLLIKNPEKINWDKLSKNNNNDAVKILETQLSRINWRELSSNTNPKALQLFKNNRKNINWLKMASNPANEAIDIMITALKTLKKEHLTSNKNPRIIEIYEKNNALIDWEYLSKINTDRALDLIENNIEKIHMYDLCLNTNPRAIKILSKNIDKISWSNLSSNTSTEAIKLLIKNPEKINWYILCSNPNINALKLIYNYINKFKTYKVPTNDPFMPINTYINWEKLSQNINPAVMKILEENEENVNYHKLVSNKNIFEKSFRFKNIIITNNKYKKLISKIQNKNR
jgi:uncharacterized cysteine cluster protein YcgN (CxxCxxCC family)